MVFFRTMTAKKTNKTASIWQCCKNRQFVSFSRSIWNAREISISSFLFFFHGFGSDDNLPGMYAFIKQTVTCISAVIPILQSCYKHFKSGTNVWNFAYSIYLCEEYSNFVIQISLLLVGRRHLTKSSNVQVVVWCKHARIPYMNHCSPTSLLTL